MILGYRKKQSIAVIASAVLHAAVAAFTLLSPREETPEPIVVEFLETESLRAKPVISSRNASASKRNREVPDRAAGQPTAEKKKSQTLKNFAFSTRESLRSNWAEQGDIAVHDGQESTTLDESQKSEGGASGDPMAALEVASGGFSSAVQYSNQMGLEFTNESVGFFQALHRRVDGPLVYPEDFSRQRLTGKVRIEAELRSDGTLVKFLSTVADNDILQVYSLAYLSHVLSQPLPPRSHLKYERTIVSFDFDFRVRVAGTNPVALETGYRKNHLLFARESLVDPWLNEKLNEIFTHYVPPIIPLPGGFYVDFIAAFKYFKNLKEGNPTESEARLRRIETLHENLKQTVRSRKPS